ncbi:UNKNOWN [Stylonychia lemnae]|uniref:F-box domain-containing protein n=1 Tax=Stylonychia lemnae TaxID=5949 RepID=A0A078ALS1_STYLE|nr:UNKNOWN [Stylonychia lemnae]|eukprot:CDW82826.1 UNKNOWN [Stylonychia lemnae]
MGCTPGCMSKAKKIYTITPSRGQIVANDFKCLLIIVDFLPLNVLIKVSKVSRKFYFISGRRPVLDKFLKKKYDDQETLERETPEIYNDKPGNETTSNLAIYSYEKANHENTDNTQDLTRQTDMASAIQRLNTNEKGVSKSQEVENFDLISILKKKTFTKPRRLLNIQSSQSGQKLPQDQEDNMYFDFIVDQKGYYQPKFLPFKANYPSTYSKKEGRTQRHQRNNSQEMNQHRVNDQHVQSQDIKDLQRTEKQHRGQMLIVEHMSSEAQSFKHPGFNVKTPNFTILNRIQSKPEESEYVEDKHDQYPGQMNLLHTRFYKKNADDSESFNAMSSGRSSSYIQSVIVTSKHIETPSSLLHQVRNRHQFVFSNIQNIKQE